MLREFLNILRVDKAFLLTSKRKDDLALKFCNDALKQYGQGRLRLSTSIIELYLLKAFLELERGERKASIHCLANYFKLRKAIPSLSRHEMDFMDRYAISVLWIARGRADNSCLLHIRARLAGDNSKVRKVLRDKFSTSNIL